MNEWMNSRNGFGSLNILLVFKYLHLFIHSIFSYENSKNAASFSPRKTENAPVFYKSEALHRRA
jgi:hypothetical protein